MDTELKKIDPFTPFDGTTTGYPAGSFVLSADERKVYRVQEDGSWRKLDITVEEFKRRRQEALDEKAAAEA